MTGAAAPTDTVTPGHVAGATVGTRRAPVGCYLLSLVGGVCLAFSLPPWGLWPLGWIGAALVFTAWRGRRPSVRLLAGEIAGLGCFVPGLWWASAFNWYGAAVLMVVEALALALAAVAVPARRGRWPAFVGACTLTEALRMHWPFGGLPMGGIFLGQASSPLLEWARVGGPILVTMAVWAIGATLATLGSAVVGGVRGHHLEPRSAVTALVAAACLAAVGVFAAGAPNGGPARGFVRVAAVQGGGRRGFSKAQVPPATVFAAQVRATQRLLAAERRGRRAQLVLWPEDVISLPGPLPGTPQEHTVAGLARALHATLVAGVTATVSSTAFDNEAVVWDPAGRVVAHYEKVHRVPFGEYVPDRGFFQHFANLSAVPLDAVPGHGSGMVHTPVGRVGIMISFEVFFPARAVSAVRAGASVLLVPTNTSSYSAAQVPSQEVAADQFEAVTTGRALVQAAPTGFSTVVSPRGVVEEHSGLGTPDVLEATVARHSGTTIYVRLGSLPVLLLAAALLAFGWAWAIRGRRAAAGRADSAHS